MIIPVAEFCKSLTDLLDETTIIRCYNQLLKTGEFEHKDTLYHNQWPVADSPFNRVQYKTKLFHGKIMPTKVPQLDLIIRVSYDTTVLSWKDDKDDIIRSYIPNEVLTYEPDPAFYKEIPNSTPQVVKVWTAKVGDLGDRGADVLHHISKQLCDTNTRLDVPVVLTHGRVVAKYYFYITAEHIDTADSCIRYRAYCTVYSTPADDGGESESEKLLSITWSPDYVHGQQISYYDVERCDLTEICLKSIEEYVSETSWVNNSGQPLSDFMGDVAHWALGKGDCACGIGQEVRSISESNLPEIV